MCEEAKRQMCLCPVASFPSVGNLLPGAVVLRTSFEIASSPANQLRDVPTLIVQLSSECLWMRLRRGVVGCS